MDLGDHRGVPPGMLLACVLGQGGQQVETSVSLRERVWRVGTRARHGKHDLALAEP